MNLENCLPSLYIGAVNDYMPVEPPGAEQGGIKDVRAVRRGNEDDPCRLVKAVEFYQQLVECLFPFVVSSA